MTTRVIIDAIQLNDDCFRPGPAPTVRRGTPAPPQCTGTFHFHLQDSGTHRITTILQDIPFQQTGVNVMVSPAANSVVNLHTSNYRLNELLGRPETQSLFTFARLLTEFRRGSETRVLDPSSDINRPESGTPPSPLTSMTRPQFRDLVTNSGQALYNFVMFGDLDHPDSTQIDYYNAMLDRLHDSGIHSRHNVPALLAAVVTCNHQTFGSSSPFVRRAQLVLNMFYISQEIQLEFVSSLTPEIRLRMRALISKIAGHLYFDSPNLADFSSFVGNLALDLYRLPPQGNPPRRINLYSTLIESLSGNIINPEDCNMGSAANRVPLASKYPFNQANSPSANRLNALLQSLRAAAGTLNEDLLRYATLPPLQATFDSIYDQFSTPQARQALVTRITTNTQIVRPAHLTAQWLAENGNLREALEACLFDPAHPERGSLTLVTGPGNQPVFQLNVSQLIQNVNALYALQVSVPRLRSNVNALLGANLTNRREFQATVIALLFSLLGERAQNTSIRAFVAGQVRSIPLRISEPDRGDLERFYAEQIRDLGRRDALTEVLAPVLQGVTCAAGLGTSIGLLATGEHNSGQFSPGLAAGGFLSGAGCAPLTARLFTGTPQNAWRQWGTVGGPVGVGLGVLMGFLPMMISAGNGGTPMMMTPPIPMGRPRDARNPTSGYGP